MKSNSNDNMPYNPGEKHKELGKATLIKQKQRKWPVERATERLRILATKEHELLVARDRLRLKRAFLAAMNEASVKKQEQIFSKTMGRIVTDRIAYFKKKGIQTKELEKRLANPEAIVKRMMVISRGGSEAMKRRLDSEIASIDRKMLKVNY